MGFSHLHADGGDKGEEEDAVGESETVRLRQWRRARRHRWGRGRRCDREGIWGKMVGGDGGGCPSLYDGTFWACPTNTCYPTTAAVACAHVYEYLYGQHTR